MIVWVKIVGFSSDERHAIQTMLRLSEGGRVRFREWQAGARLSPNLLLVDTESHAAELEIQSPSFNPLIKSIAVGHSLQVPGVWRCFDRPMEWGKVLHELETLFVSPEPDTELHSPDDFAPTTVIDDVPPGLRSGLIVGLSREAQFYLKARLSLQGISHVDEVDDAAAAAERMGQRRYNLVVFQCPLPGADARSFVSALQERQVEAPMSVVAVVADEDRSSRQAIDSLGILGVLDFPFVPHQVGALIAQI